MSMSHENVPSTSASPAPVLSYKRNKNKPPPLTDAPRDNAGTPVGSHTPQQNLSVPSTPNSVPGTPSLGGARKVSNRRKALQDFYRLNSDTDNASSDAASKKDEAGQEAGLGIAVTSDETDPKRRNEGPEELSGDALLRKLNTPEAVDEFIKTASTREILKARNAAAARLNLHDSEQKSMIYNNYSELIKLNQILNDVFAGQQSISEFSHDDDEPKVTNDSIDQYLAELSGFLKTDAAVFNQDFSKVVESICSKIDGADSVASVTGISG